MDGAREILDAANERRWSNLQHYYMSFAHKEMAKQVLQFKSVPFYVVLNSEGEILQKGNAINWEALLPSKAVDENKENNKANEADREFVLDDLDF